MKENMFYGASPLIFQRAQKLRNNMTDAEAIVWKAIHVNQWHLKFRRQHPIANYIVDFYCHPIKLIIEIEGEIHNDEEVKKLDTDRENHLKEIGLTILRFTNKEVLKNSTRVFQTIDKKINQLQKKSTEKNYANSFPKHSMDFSPSGEGGRSLIIIKIGGNIIDDDEKLFLFLKDFAAIEQKKILVHGGGKLATKLAEQLGIQQQLIEGRRITDSETLKIVTMVYAGYINKNLVAQLQSHNCNAIGLSGADGNLIQSHKRLPNSSLGDGGRGTDYGFVGDIDSINIELLQLLLDKNIALILAPLTHDKKGQVLNTNADTIAQEIAKALSTNYDVSLIYSFEKSGVLQNADDDNTVIKQIDPESYNDLKQRKLIFAGMIPKLDNAFAALNSGVKKVIIGKAEHIHQLIKGEAGTTIIN